MIAMATQKHSNVSAAASVAALGAAAVPPMSAADAAATTALNTQATPSGPVSRFQIRDNVPLPTRGRAVVGETMYPFALLNVGQSFFVPSTDNMKEPWKTLTSLTSRTSREMFPKQFATAKHEEAGNKGVMVWRIEDAVGEQKPPRTRTSRKASEATASADQAPPAPPAPPVPPAPPAAG